MEKEEAVINGYESWLKNRPIKEARAVAGDVAEDEKKKKKR
ncbi:MAG: hypothetical protein OK456_09255 [Thaumarchaeota archaeon]|nr:hypothetical protein [Nitrososphaerota archaeon]